MTTTPTQPMTPTEEVKAELFVPDALSEAFSEKVIPESLALSLAQRLEAAQQRIGELENDLKVQSETYTESRKFTTETIRTTAKQRDSAQQQCESMRAGLQEIRTQAHCISKAGPLSTPTLADAWNKFDMLSVLAVKALSTPSHGWVKAEVVKGLVESVERLMRHCDSTSNGETVYERDLLAVQSALAVAQEAVK